MIKINDKIYNNLQQQVAVNADNIIKLKEAIENLDPSGGTKVEVIPYNGNNPELGGLKVNDDSYKIQFYTTGTGLDMEDGYIIKLSSTSADILDRIANILDEDEDKITIDRLVVNDDASIDDLTTTSITTTEILGNSIEVNAPLTKYYPDTTMYDAKESKQFLVSVEDTDGEIAGVLGISYCNLSTFDDEDFTYLLDLDVLQSQLTQEKLDFLYKLAKGLNVYSNTLGNINDRRIATKEKTVWITQVANNIVEYAMVDNSNYSYIYRLKFQYSNGSYQVSDFVNNSYFYLALQPIFN